MANKNNGAVRKDSVEFEMQYDCFKQHLIETLENIKKKKQEKTIDIINYVN